MWHSGRATGTAPRLHLHLCRFLWTLFIFVSLLLNFVGIEISIFGTVWVDHYFVISYQYVGIQQVSNDITCTYPTKICLIWLETPSLSGKILKYPRAYQDIELLSTRVFQGSLGTLFLREETPASIRCPTLIVTSLEFKLKELRRLSVFVTKYISFFEI